MPRIFRMPAITPTFTSFRVEADGYRERSILS
jgi:hypothetical protein